MTLAEFGVDPGDPELEETRYEFEKRAGPWSILEPELDDSVSPAKTRCPDCGCNLAPIEPVLLDYGRDDDLLLACKLCQDCQNILPSHTSSQEDHREQSDLTYPYRTLKLYEPSRVTDDEYPPWDLHLLRELNGELSRGDQA